MSRRTKSTAKQRRKKNLWPLLFIGLIVFVAIEIAVTYKPDLKPVATINPKETTTMLPQAIPVTREDLDTLRAVPGLGDLLKATDDRLTTYQSWYDDLRSTGNGDLQIDLILQVHDYNGSGADVPRVVVQCQRRILSHLIRNKYDLVTDEGHSLDRMTYEGERALAISTIRAMGQFMSAEMYDQTYQKFLLKGDAGLQYMERYPDRHVMGGEDLPLNGLHDGLLSYLDSPMPSASQRPRLEEVSLHLRVLRSILPLAKTVRMMHEHHYRRAAIVIGIMHRPEMENIMQSLGMRGNIYDATR